LALRLALWSQPLHQLANDEVEYVAVARDLLAGRGWQFYESYHWLRAPLYPLFLAGSLWLAGGDLRAAALPNIALSAATVALYYALARELGGTRRAAALAALTGGTLFTLATFASLYMAETLFGFLFAAGLLLLLRWRRSGQTAALAAAGALIGLATLTRSATLAFLPVVALWIFANAERESRSAIWWSRRAINACCLFTLTCSAVILPWTLRNCAVYGRCILVETGLSYNLWAFNEPRESEEEIFRTLEAIPNPADRADYATTKGLSRLREDPAILARKLWPNWRDLLRVKPIEDRFILPTYYADPPPLVFLAALLLDDALYAFIVLAGIVGLWRLRDARARLLCAAWVGLFVATTLLTHGEGRYRHFLYPVLIPCAALALSGVRHSPFTRRSPSAMRLSPLVLGALVAFVGYTIAIHYPWQYGGGGAARSAFALAGDAALLRGDAAGAARLYQGAIAAGETPDSWLRLGRAQAAAGDTAAALAAYRAGSQLAPNYIAPHALRADQLRALGRRDEAREEFAPSYTSPQAMLNWTWDNLRPTPSAGFAVGDGLDFGYLRGFYPAETFGERLARWTTGEAQLRLSGQGASQVLRLHMAAPRLDGSRVSITICSEGRCTRIALAPGWRSYSVPLPPTPEAARIVELRPDTFRDADGRILGVVIDWVSIR
jgi:4-amino-4-deoxy-L-arabinose transferase-like glycosyltransferase